MHLFNAAAGKMTKYASPLELMSEFIPIRLTAYQARKEAMITVLQETIQLMKNKAMFIAAVVAGTLVVTGRKQKELYNDLDSQGFDRLDKDKTTGGNNNSGSSDTAREGGQDEEEGAVDEEEGTSKSAR